MNQLAARTISISPSTLSVSYNSSAITDEPANAMAEAVIVTDARFIIQGLSNTAETMYGFSAAFAKGQKLFELVKFEMIGIGLDASIKNLFKHGFWKGDIIYNYNDKKIIFNTRCNLIKDENGRASSIVIVTHNISARVSQEKILSEEEFKYQSLIKSVSEGVKLVNDCGAGLAEKTSAKTEIDKIFERYTTAINASLDAIWDMDATSEMIYRSDNFNAFSGYNREEVMPTLKWFLSKIHPLDKKRIKRNVDYCLANNIVYWENEYRFQIADGSYRHLLDKAYAIYEQGKLSRVIGAMQDMTERKKLEAQLLNEQVQQQKMVNQAIIHAQEKERNRISGELHDNVNQLLMSAKLHICVAKTKAGVETELLEKANQYLLMAVEEIRGLSKRLSTSVMTSTGLLKSISEIGSTMMLLKNIHLHTYISDEVVAKMSGNQQMMVYRIIQEQSNNILKYAETQEAIISLKIVDANFELIISDNGQGFDKKLQKTNGIGFINIFNRVDSHNGKVEIITSPGHGCTLLINFPVIEEAPL